MFIDYIQNFIRITKKIIMNGTWLDKIDKNVQKNTKSLIEKIKFSFNKQLLKW